MLAANVYRSNAVPPSMLSMTDGEIERVLYSVLCAGIGVDLPKRTSVVATVVSCRHAIIPSDLLPEHDDPLAPFRSADDAYIQIDSTWKLELVKLVRIGSFGEEHFQWFTYRTATTV